MQTQRHCHDWRRLYRRALVPSRKRWEPVGRHSHWCSEFFGVRWPLECGGLAPLWPNGSIKGEVDTKAVPGHRTPRKVTALQGGSPHSKEGHPVLQGRKGVMNADAAFAIGSTHAVCQDYV